MVDTLGLLIAVIVHSAAIQDRDGAKLLVEQARRERQLPRMRLVWADGGYAGKLIAWLATTCQWLLEIVKRSDDAQGFVVLPRRWVVERTFAWLNQYRRLSKDYEHLPSSGEAMIYVAMIRLMLRRLNR